jgi:CheY-like chemotaxis protein
MLRTAATLSSTTSPGHRPPVAPERAARKLVIVNGSTESAALVEATLDGGRYDMVFVASNAQAYSQIKREQPNLVVLCLQANHVEGFQVLSMLKLDEATRQIPVVTVSTEDQDDSEMSRMIQDDEHDADEASDRFFVRPSPSVMN